MILIPSKEKKSFDTSKRLLLKTILKNRCKIITTLRSYNTRPLGKDTCFPNSPKFVPPRHYSIQVISAAHVEIFNIHSFIRPSPKFKRDLPPNCPSLVNTHYYQVLSILPSLFFDFSYPILNFETLVLHLTLFLLQCQNLKP